MSVQPIIPRINVNFHGHLKRQSIHHLFLDQQAHRLLIEEEMVNAFPQSWHAI